MFVWQSQSAQLEVGQVQELQELVKVVPKANILIYCHRLNARLTNTNTYMRWLGVEIQLGMSERVNQQHRHIDDDDEMTTDDIQLDVGN